VKIPDVAKIIIKGFYDQVMNCVKYNLHCLDPPCLTAGMLDQYGISNYSAKTSFWKAVDNIISKYNGVEIFRSRFGSFKLVFYHNIEEIYRIENSNIYVDVLDCDIVECDITPRSHVLRIYLEGEYSNRVVLRINVVTLAKLAVFENPYFKDCLELFAIDPFSLSSIISLTKCIAVTLHRHQSIFSILFNRKPKDVVDIVKRSPLIKKFVDVHTVFGEGLQQSSKH